MDVSQLTLFTLFVLLFGILGLAMVSQKYQASLAIIIVIVNTILTTIPSILALKGGVQVGSFILPNLPVKVIDMRIDSLSAWFILIINFTSINGAFFGSSYLKSYKHLKTNITLHWVFYILFHISMVWVCMFDNGILFLISWELMLMSSFMLVIFEFQISKNIRAGIKYLINMHISVVFLTIGFIWIFAESGSFNISALAAVVSNNHAIWIFILFAIGFAIKAGFLPFHTWLPDADSTAPSHVAGVMSGVIVKLGIYGILRIVSYFNHDLLIIGEIFLSISVLTAIYGIINAVVKLDFNRSLAYCSMENIGIIGIGIGLGSIGLGTNHHKLILLGFSGALLHSLNHSLFKSLLFFSTGSIFHRTKTRNIEKLGGLIKSMPVTALFFILGALAIAGLPPLNGFVSEYLIYSGLFTALLNVNEISMVILIILSIVGMALVGGMSIFAFTKLFGTMFLGRPRAKFKHEPSETSFIMHLPQYSIVVIMLTVALFPQFYLDQSAHIISSVFNSGLPLNSIHLVSTNANMESVGRVSFFFIMLLVVLYGLRHYLVKKRNQSTGETWSCAYVTPIVKAQYSGRSYARTFGNLFSFIVTERKSFNKSSKGELYPGYRKFSTFYFDFLETYLVTPIIKRIYIVLNYFQFVQNGKIQSYLIYSLFFILIVFIGTALGFII